LTYGKQARWEESEKLDVQVIKTKLAADHLETLMGISNLEREEEEEKRRKKKRRKKWKKKWKKKGRKKKRKRRKRIGGEGRWL
jgi:hypothetical protein